MMRAGHPEWKPHPSQVMLERHGHIIFNTALSFFFSIYYLALNFLATVTLFHAIIKSALYYIN